MKLRNIKDDILIEIFHLSRELQENQPKWWMNARLIEWLSSIATELNNDGLKQAFLKWLDTDEQRDYYKQIIY